MIEIINDKSARLQKIFLIFLISLIVILVPLTAENETSNTTQPLEEVIEEAVEEIINETLDIISTEENVSDILEVSENETINTTSNQPIENVSISVNETNQIVEPSPELPEEPTSLPSEDTLGAQPPLEEYSPNLDVKLLANEKITRGNEIEITASISNLDQKNISNVSFEWEIPNGFTLVEGNSKGTIQRIGPGETERVSLVLETSTATSLGINKIKFLVNY